MGIHKIRRTLHVPGMIATGVGSFADMNVNSTMAMDSLTLTSALSAATVNVGSNFTGYNLAYTNLGSVSNLNVSSVMVAEALNVTEVGSVGGLNVGSNFTGLNLAYTGTGSVAAINVSSNITAYQLTGNDRFRGIATIAQSAATVTISAAAVSSGKAIALTPYTNSISGLKVNSIVDNTSFMAVTVNDDPLAAATVLSYIIME